jgi:hypothetical protein
VSYSSWISGILVSVGANLYRVEFHFGRSFRYCYFVYRPTVVLASFWAAGKRRKIISGHRSCMGYVLLG